MSKNGVFAGDKSHQFGALHAAHLTGAGAASQYLKKGKDKVDGYGTSASSRYQYGKQQFAKLNLTSQVATSVSTAQHREPTTSPLNVSKVSEKHIEIPAVHVEKKEDYHSLSKTIEQQAVKNKEKNTKTSTIIAANSVDPIFQFLTQDVSERRIAHIVTGGLLRTERI